MTNKMRYLLILALNLFISLCCFLLMYNDRSLTNLINTLFYITAFYMIIYLLLLIIKGKFFDGITFGVRRFKNKLFNIDEFDTTQAMPLPSEKVNVMIYHICKQQFFTLVVLLAVLLIFYYL